MYSGSKPAGEELGEGAAALDAKKLEELGGSKPCNSNAALPVLAHGSKPAVVDEPGSKPVMTTASGSKPI